MLSTVTALAGGSAVAVTLMACYGLPPCQEKVDEDGDGYFVCLDNGYLSNEDCNDADPSIHPGAIDAPDDGVDSNCDRKAEPSVNQGGAGGGGGGGEGGHGGGGGSGGGVAGAAGSG